MLSNIYLREKIFFFTIYFFLLIALSTEFLSIFNLINYQSIRILWLLTVIIFFFINYNFLKKFNLKYFFKSKKVDFYLIILILFITFITSIIYPPNTINSMQYHLTKVLHWIQNKNLDFYPTNDLRELILAPLAEFTILHLYLIFGGDYFSNLVQWYSMIVTCLVVSLISKELNCNYKFQIFSILFCVTLPMGILQSSSTQNNYVMSLWLVIMAYSLIKFRKNNKFKYLFTFSVSVGLGILTKATFYFFAFPFFIWFILILLNSPLNKKYLFFFLIPIIIITINLGHFYRVTKLYQNPLGLSEETVKWNNEIIDHKVLLSNSIKNFSLNLATPLKEKNESLSKLINKINNFIGIESSDSRTTLGGRGYYIPFSLYESTAPNTLHFLIFFFSIFFLQKKNNQFIKFYFISIAVGFFLFSLLVKWAPQNNRILLSLFILMAPLVAYIFENSLLKNFYKFIISILFIWALPYLFFNKSRPILASIILYEKRISFEKPFFLTLNREELYYIADKNLSNRELYKIHLKILDQIILNNCNYIGFDDYYDNLDYPFWIILKKKLNKEFYFYNVNVSNKSKVYSKRFNILTNITNNNCIVKL